MAMSLYEKITQYIFLGISDGKETTSMCKLRASFLAGLMKGSRRYQTWLIYFPASVFVLFFESFVFHRGFLTTSVRRFTAVLNLSHCSTLTHFNQVHWAVVRFKLMQDRAIAPLGHEINLNRYN